MARAFCKLATEVIALEANHIPASKNALFLHGILGSKRNWRTPAREVLKVLPRDYIGLAVDHRGHGESSTEGLTSPHTVESCAADLSHSLALFAPPALLVAHSFGGKVALRYLRHCIEHRLPLPAHTWVLDSFPGPYTAAYDSAAQQSVARVLDVLSRAPTAYKSRNEAIKHLTEQHIALPVAQWLATSLVPSAGGDGLAYCFDLRCVRALFDDFCRTDMWDFLEGYSGEGAIHFVRAGKNNSWTRDALGRFESITKSNPKISFQTMPHVGHWLHAEDPQGIAKLIGAKL